MNSLQKSKRINWSTIIPIMFWIACMIMSFGKMVQNTDCIRLIDLLDIFNGNTFSTYISMVICMAYQFFSGNNSKRQEKSGLSRKWISLSIMSTIFYGIMSVVNTCIYNLITTILMSICSFIYIILYFAFMRKR